MDTKNYRPSSHHQSTPAVPCENDYRVVVGYRAQCEGELDLRLNDAVSSVKPLGNGWSLGRIITTDDSIGEVGIFPSSCVEHMTSSMQTTASAKFEPLAASDVTSGAGVDLLDYGAASSCVK